MRVPSGTSARFTLLLGAMLLLMILVPLVRGLALGEAIVTALFLIVIGVGALAPDTGRGLRLVLAGLVVVAIALRLSSAPPAHFFNAVLLGFIAALMLNQILRSDGVTSDTIVGGICVYLLVGLASAQGFAGIDRVTEAAFRSGEPLRADDFLYFSFVTLTTLGYGDIVPVHGAARTLAVLEAVLGPLYLAILIARLVGLRLHTIDSGSEDDE